MGMHSGEKRKCGARTYQHNNRSRLRQIRQPLGVLRLSCVPAGGWKVTDDVTPVGFQRMHRDRKGFAALSQEVDGHTSSAAPRSRRCCRRCCGCFGGVDHGGPCCCCSRCLRACANASGSIARSDVSRFCYEHSLFITGVMQLAAILTLELRMPDLFLRVGALSSPPPPSTTTSSSSSSTISIWQDDDRIEVLLVTASAVVFLFFSCLALLLATGHMIDLIRRGLGSPGRLWHIYISMTLCFGALHAVAFVLSGGAGYHIPETAPQTQNDVVRAFVAFYCT